MAVIRYLGRTIPLGDKPIVVGREPECTISTSDETVTRKHARIYRDNDRCWIEDLGSDNGTYVNRTRIDRPSTLSADDEIMCGRLTIVFASG